MMITQEKDEWMRRAPFLPALNDILADMGGRYADDVAIIRSAEFRQRMDALAARTPGVAEWLAEMPV